MKEEYENLFEDESVPQTFDEFNKQESESTEEINGNVFGTETENLLKEEPVIDVEPVSEVEPAPEVEPVKEEQVKEEPVTNVSEEETKEDSENISTNNTNVDKNETYNPLEHPDAKIVLNKEVEERELEDVSDVDIKEELKSNKSLKFVLILGLIILIAIFLIPYLSNLLGN